MKYIMLGFLLNFCVLVGCQNIAEYKNLNSVDFAEELSKSNNPQILDVRTSGEYATGHLENSLQADWNNQQEFVARIEALDKNKAVFIYCQAGGRSKQAAKFLSERGFNAVNMSGGINEWSSLKLPLVGQKLDPSKVVEKSRYQEFIQRKGFVLIDFGAEWCPPCRKMKPLIAEFLKAYETVQFLYIEVPQNQQLFESIGFKSMPVFELYKDGKRVFVKEGAFDIKDLEAKMN